MVRRQAAKARRQGQVGRITAKGLSIERGNDHGQAQAQVDLAGAGQSGRINDLNRRGAILDL